jgi:hypothetical protein
MAEPIETMSYEWIPVADLESYLVDDDWVAEQKLDGVRCMAVFGQAAAQFTTGGGRAITFAAAAQHFPALRQDLAAFDGQDVILDGELLPDGTYVVFDIPWCLGDLRDDPFERRRRLLEHVASSHFRGRVRLVDQAAGEEAKRALWHRVREHGAEGICLKRRTGRYRRDRKRTLEVLKVKITHTVDVVVMERNTGAPGSMNATLGLYRDGELVQVGGCSMIGKPDLQPGDVGEVEFLYVPDPANPSLYQPRLVRARPDKEPTACTWEQLRGKAANRSVITAEEPTMTTATIPAIQITVTSHQAKLAQSIGLEVAGGCIVVEPDDVTNVARELEAKMALQPRGKRGPWKAILERIIATGLVADNPTTIPEVESGEPSAPEIVSIVETPAGPTVVTDDGVVVDMTVIDVVESNHPNRPVVLRPAEGRAARFMGWDSAENWARELVTSGQQAQVVVTDELSGRQGTFRKAS